MLDSVALDAAIARGAEHAFDFLERLVAAPSTVGPEAGALEVFAAEIADLGFTVGDGPLAPTSVTTPGPVSCPRLPGPRFQVVGTMGPESGRSLLLNGHIDVVPAETPEPVDLAAVRTASRRAPALRSRRGGHEGRLRHGRAGPARPARGPPGRRHRPADASWPRSRRSAPATARCPPRSRACSPTPPCCSSRPTSDLLVGGRRRPVVRRRGRRRLGPRRVRAPGDQPRRPADAAGGRAAATGRRARRAVPDRALADVVSPYNVNVGRGPRRRLAVERPDHGDDAAARRLPRAWTPDDAEREVARSAPSHRRGGRRVPLRPERPAQRLPRGGLLPRSRAPAGDGHGRTPTSDAHGTRASRVLPRQHHRRTVLPQRLRHPGALLRGDRPRHPRGRRVRRPAQGRRRRQDAGPLPRTPTTPRGRCGREDAVRSARRRPVRRARPRRGRAAGRGWSLAMSPTRSSTAS